MQDVDISIYRNVDQEGESFYIYVHTNRKNPAAMACVNCLSLEAFKGAQYGFRFSRGQKHACNNLKTRLDRCTGFILKQIVT